MPPIEQSSLILYGTLGIRLPIVCSCWDIHSLEPQCEGLVASYNGFHTWGWKNSCSSTLPGNCIGQNLLVYSSGNQRGTLSWSDPQHKPCPLSCWEGQFACCHARNNTTSSFMSCPLCLQQELWSHAYPEQESNESRGSVAIAWEQMPLQSGLLWCIVINEVVEEWKVACSYLAVFFTKEWFVDYAWHHFLLEQVKVGMSSQRFWNGGGCTKMCPVTILLAVFNTLWKILCLR